MESGAERSLSPSILEYDVFELADRIFDSYPEPEGLADFGPYEVRERIDNGGMGEVWRAYDYIACREVAIKIPRYLADPSLRRRFAAEVSNQARLEHPFIARLYDHGVCPDGTPYFAMEFVDGKPLDEYCRDKRLPLKERVKLLRAVCEAVQYAHGLLVVHRDLKPSNILVKEDGTPKLLDFGIAARLERVGEPARQTQTELRFTRAFAAPEQFRREPVGVYTDVYALGVILYQMLTDRLPYELEDCTPGQAELLVTSEKEPERPSAVAKRVSEEQRTSKADWNDLDVLCLKAMKKEVKERYGTVFELQQDIDHYLNGEPLEVRREGLRYRFGKFVARNRSGVLAAFLITALVMSLVVFFTVRLASERNRALAEAARTREIQSFMLTLFGAGDKEAGPSQELRVVTMLDRGVNVAARLNSDPETQAELYESLGQMYRMLGRYQQADKLLQLALQKMKRAVGPEDVKNVDFLLQLGALRGDQGQPKEAERLIRKGLDLASRHLPPEDVTVVSATSALGRVLAQGGAYEKAIEVLEPLIKIPHSGSEETNTYSETLVSLGYSNHYSGHLDRAQELYGQALALDRKLYGGAHPRVAEDLANLGTTAAILGRDVEAEQFYREAAGIVKGWYGADNPETLQVMSYMALMEVKQNKLAEAEPLLRQVLTVEESTYGKDHPIVGFTLDTLGKIALKEGKLSEAESYYNRALAIYQTSHGMSDPQTAMIQAHLGDVLEAEKQYSQAEKLFREALKTITSRPFKGNVSVGVVEVSLGQALLRQKKYGDAESHLVAGYAILTEQPGAFAARLEQARADLATVYTALHQSGKAAKFREEMAANREPVR